MAKRSRADFDAFNDAGSVDIEFGDGSESLVSGFPKRGTGFKRPVMDIGEEEQPLAEHLFETVMDYNEDDEGKSDSEYEYQFVDDEDETGDAAGATSAAAVGDTSSMKSTPLKSETSTSMDTPMSLADGTAEERMDDARLWADAEEEEAAAVQPTVRVPQVSGVTALQWDSDDAIECESSDNHGNSDTTSADGTSKEQVWLPQYGLTDAQCESIEYASKAYTILHRMHTDWPCLSFDIIPDGLGDLRNQAPFSAFLCTGTQASSEVCAAKAQALGEQAKMRAHVMAKRTNTLKIIKVSQLQKTKYDSDSEIEDSEDDDEGGRRLRKKHGQSGGLVTLEDGEDDMNDGRPGHIDDDAGSESLIQSRDIWHPSVVNRVRCSGRTRSHIIATMGEDRTLRIFNAKQHLLSLDGVAEDLESVTKSTPYSVISSAQSRKSSSKMTLPSTVLLFEDTQRDEGFGLGWSKIDEGRLVSGNCAGELSLFTPHSGGSFVKQHSFRTDKSSIEDVVWSPKESMVFMTVGTDRCIRLWDCRKPKLPVRMNYGCHADDINVCDWNSFNTNLVCTGSDDCSFKIWDLRKFTDLSIRGSEKKHQKRMRKLKSGLKSAECGKKDGVFAHYQWHTKPITSVQWHPFDSSSVIVSSEDNQISVWDLSVEEDNEASPAAASTAGDSGPASVRVPAQLMFVHAQKNVKEIRFHPQIPSLAIATGETGFHFFKPDNLDISDAISRLTL